MSVDLASLPLAQIRRKGKAAIAAALTLIEEKPFDDAAVTLLEEAYANPRGVVIGITGPPGAGKSTLINTLTGAFRREGLSVAVLAVDPSSKASGGALLGDRVRMKADPADQGVFIRSLAARERLGGLADAAYPAVILLRSFYDKVIVESVGVGQSETDIANIADSVVLCVQPGSGDSLQFMKAGILEIPDIAVVTKADLGAIATRALADLKGALSLRAKEAEAFEASCLALSALTSSGVTDLLAAISAHAAWLNERERLCARRQAQAKQWLEAEILANFGRKGLEAAAGFAVSPVSGPFRTAKTLLSALKISLEP